MSSYFPHLKPRSRPRGGHALPALAPKPLALPDRLLLAEAPELKQVAEAGGCRRAAEAREDLLLQGGKPSKKWCEGRRVQL